MFDDRGATATTGPGGRPIDMALDRSSRHLYALNSGTDQIVRLDIAPDGSLLETGEMVAVPDGRNGLVVR